MGNLEFVFGVFKDSGGSGIPGFPDSERETNGNEKEPVPVKGSGSRKFLRSVGESLSKAIPSRDRSSGPLSSRDEDLRVPALTLI